MFLENWDQLWTAKVSKQSNIIPEVAIFSVMLLLLKRVYLYWKYEFSRKCCAYFIKRTHSLVETFFDFYLSKLRAVLTKVYSEMFEIFIIFHRKCSEKYVKTTFSLQKITFGPQFYRKQHIFGYITRTPSRFQNRLCWDLLIAPFDICWWKRFVVPPLIRDFGTFYWS